MGRAEKYALIQSQLLTWVLIVVVAYFVATKASVVLAGVYVGIMLGLAVWIGYRVRRAARSERSEESTRTVP